MKAKKLLALLCCGFMTVGMLAGCGSKDEKDAGKEDESNKVEFSAEDPAGYYQWTYEVEGLGKWVNYIHLYEESSIGKVYYLGIASNQITQAGTYEILEEKSDYEVSFKRAEEGEEEELKTGSTDYTIVFYSFDGTEVGRCAYDGQYIYNDTEKVCGTGCEKVRMEKDPEGLDSDKGQADSGYKGEVGIAYVKAVSTTDDTCTLALNHNGTYQDLIGEYEVVGTWKKDGNTYTLTPDDSTDTGAVVVVSDAGDTATYTPDGGEAVELTIDVSKPVVVQFVGIAPGAAAGNDADLWINCYTDSTAEVFIGAFGVELSCGTGTYETNEDGSIVVTIDGMDPMTLALDAANDVSIVGTPVGDISTSVEKGEH